jgi:Ca-activated chloride channel family protein
MTIRNLIFEFPQAIFFLFLVLPLLFLQIYLLKYRQKKTEAFTSHKASSNLLIPRSHFFSWIKIVCLCLGWVLACLAWMDPQGNFRYLSFTGQSSTQNNKHLTKRDPSHEIVLLVDTSASMDVKDDPNKPTRLEQSKDIMDDLVASLTGQTLSLYAFTSVLTPLVPETHDYLFTRMMIKSLSINEGDVEGTNFETSLISLKEKLFQAPQNKLFTLILFSDGGDKQVETSQGIEKEQHIKKISTILPDANDYHIQFFTVGMGSNQPQIIPNVTFEGKSVYSKLEPLLLEQLAKQEHGKYYQADQWTNSQLAEELIKQMMDESFYKQLDPSQSLERKVHLIKRDELLSDLYYQIPLGAGIIFLLFYLILPSVRR